MTGKKEEAGRDHARHSDQTRTNESVTSVATWRTQMSETTNQEASVDEIEAVVESARASMPPTRLGEQIAKFEGERERRYYWDSPKPIDLSKLLDGERQEMLSPKLFHRVDGVGLFYHGKVNDLWGDPESGKTMIALAAAVQKLVQEPYGGKVMFLDLDRNEPGDIVERLLMLGAPREALISDDSGERPAFEYYQPRDVPDVLQHVHDFAWAYLDSLVIVDSVSELLEMFGADQNQADEYATVVHKLADPLVTPGHCVLLVDHAARGPEARKTGTLAKQRLINGTSLEVRPVRQFVPGLGGAADLVVAKDRSGGVRQHCPSSGGVGRRQLAGTFVLDQPRADGSAEWQVEAPVLKMPAAAPKCDATTDSMWLATAGKLGEFTAEQFAAAANHRGVPARAQLQAARRAIRELVAAGDLRVVREGRQGRGGAGVYALHEKHTASVKEHAKAQKAQ